MEETVLDGMAKHPPFDEDKSGTSRAIILAATYGEGEPTDNATEIVNEMKECMEDEEKKNVLHGLEYCVFGLANRQYDHFNAMGKFFDSASEKLGGKRIMPLGVGDDDNDLEADFETWKDQLWVQLRKKYCKDAALPAKVAEDETKLPECDYEIEYHDSKTQPQDIPLDQVHGSSKPYFTSVDCPVTTCRELRSPEDGGSTVHMEIDIPNTLTYQTADNLGVLPLNDDDVVRSVAQSLGYDLDAVFSLKAAPDHEWHGAPFPMPISVKECLTRYLDLTSAPRRSDLKLLVQYAKNPIDRKALQRLSSKEGKKEYKEKIMEGDVGIIDLLKLCPSLSIPLEHFIGLCHFLLPRFYTIASSSCVFPKQVHLTVAVTEYKRKDGSTFNGVCSTHLASLKPSNNGMVTIFNRPSTFRLPDDCKKPIIMIGPGTGVAPMRALLQERRYQREVQKKSVGLNILYFGCKKSNLDYLYQEEIESFQNEGLLNKLYLAFSREQNEKVYVQHLLSENAKETWNLIHAETASIYVCGGVRMGHDVSEALKEIATKEGGMSPENAKDYLAQLGRDGRFIQELWA
jgi:NADPH-ferrihemoprotein reductase